MTTTTTEKGKQGEEIAVEYLQENGMAILDRNWRSGSYEIDIVARDGNILVFVEVKARATNIWGEPQTSVTADKQKNLIRAANKYVTIKDIDSDVRFDIVSIIIKNEDDDIVHIPNAFSIY